MTRTAVALATDAAGNLALSVTVRDSDGADAVIDSGTTSIPANELAECEASLRAENLLVTSAQYASDLATHAASDALAALNFIEPRLFTNMNTFRVAHLNQPVGLTVLKNANQIRLPVVSAV
jgi:hypothetical protein